MAPSIEQIALSHPTVNKILRIAPSCNTRPVAGLQEPNSLK